MGAKKVRTRKATRRDAAARFAGKAAEFEAAAQTALAEGFYMAATSLAVHSGICCADAFLIVVTGERSAGPDHRTAVELVRRLSPAGSALAKQLERLLAVKSDAEYDPAPITQRTTEVSVKRATRCVELVTKEIETLRQR